MVSRIWNLSVYPRAAKHFARVQPTVFAEHPTCVHATLLSTIRSVAPNEGFDLHRGNAQLPARTPSMYTTRSFRFAFRNSFPILFAFPTTKQPDTSATDPDTNETLLYISSLFYAGNYRDRITGYQPRRW